MAWSSSPGSTGERSADGTGATRPSNPRTHTLSLQSDAYAHTPPSNDTGRCDLRSRKMLAKCNWHCGFPRCRRRLNPWAVLGAPRWYDGWNYRRLHWIGCNWSSERSKRLRHPCPSGSDNCVSNQTAAPQQAPLSASEPWPMLCLTSSATVPRPVQPDVWSERGDLCRGRGGRHSRQRHMALSRITEHDVHLVRAIN